MTLPAFPQWCEITLEEKPVFDRVLASSPPELSTYTFTNLFAWRNAYNSRFTTLDGMILVRDEIEGRMVFLEPMGQGDVHRAVLRVFEETDGEVVFQRLHRRVAELFEGDSGFVVERDADNSDYVYLSTDLIELAGRKYDAKRNFINRFKLTHEYEYLPMSQSSVEEAHRFADLWCDHKMCHTVDGLRREQCAVYEMLMNFDALGITGGIIRVNGEVAAFELGEALNPETMVIHVEKADAAFDGIYQLVNNEFCTHEAAGFKYVNREQDLGVPGLRKAKESYHPVKMSDAYTLRRV